MTHKLEAEQYGSLKRTVDKAQTDVNTENSFRTSYVRLKNGLEDMLRMRNIELSPDAKSRVAYEVLGVLAQEGISPHFNALLRARSVLEPPIGRK